MNKRIQELFDKAVSDVDYIRDDEYTNLELQKMYIPDCFAERFAELLIKECAELATKEYNNYGSLHGKDLLEHFGVEL